MEKNMKEKLVKTFMESEVVTKAFNELDRIWPRYLESLAKKGQRSAKLTYADLKLAMGMDDISNDTAYDIAKSWCKKNKLYLDIAICDTSYDVSIEW